MVHMILKSSFSLHMFFISDSLSEELQRHSSENDFQITWYIWQEFPARSTVEVSCFPFLGCGGAKGNYFSRVLLLHHSLRSTRHVMSTPKKHKTATRVLQGSIEGYIWKWATLYVKACFPYVKVCFSDGKAYVCYLTACYSYVKECFSYVKGYFPYVIVCFPNARACFSCVKAYFPIVKAGFPL